MPELSLNLLRNVSDVGIATVRALAAGVSFKNQDRG